jgi:hypothetical protein
MSFVQKIIIELTMENEKRKLEIVEQYIDAYNNFDVEGMIKDLHEDIIFKNISNGEVNMITNGKTEFEDQAYQAKQFFKTRQQTIIETILDDEYIEIAISYQGVIAVDLPNGLKENDKIELQGKSIFKFTKDKIIEINDIS